MVANKNIYYEHVIKEIGFDPVLDYGIYDPMPDENSKKLRMPLLECDSEGNILYNIMDINGEIRTHDISDAKSKVNIRPIQLVRKCDPGDGPKYLPGKTGQGVFPWISREVVEAFKKKTKIKRLVLTEGYKKAFVACKYDIMTIGLPGITVWKAKEAKEIFSDIKLFIETCQVEDILWLTDADTLHVQWEPNKDLYKRPNSFFTSVSMFKTLCRDWNVNLYYAHIHEESKDKGIDDLLLANPKDSKKIVKELSSSSGQAYYFKKYNVSTMPYYKIQEIFGIDKDASAFYDKYGQFIGLEEFIYRNGVYSFDVEKNELIYRKSGEAAQFIRVMKDYYMKASMPTAAAFVKNTLIPTDKSSIQEKYKERPKKEVDRLLYDIEFFDGFFNEPEHLNYKPSIVAISDEGFETKWFNKYMKLTHKPILNKVITEKDIPLSIKFIKHIFGKGKLTYKGKEIDEWELGLDYMQLLYLQPKQFLPIIALVSKDQQTGKTIFWRWCVSIFQQNAKIIPPEMLTGNFTEYFINSLLIVIDEALFNKRETMERVKTMTTNSETMVNGKHAKEMETQTYLKIGLSSNNVNDFAILTKDDQRFWIRDIPKIPDEDYIPDFLQKLNDEIPAFLGYLCKREMATQKDDDRMYFSMDVRKTVGLDRVVDKSRPADEILIENTIKDYMTSVNKLVVHLGKGDIRDLSGEKNLLSLNKITWVLETKWDKKPRGHCGKYKFYSLIPSDSMEIESLVQHRVRSTNYYTFTALDFFKPTFILEIFPKDEIIEAEAEYGFDLKSKIHADEFWLIKYAPPKVPPCDKETFLTIYNSHSTFKGMYDALSNFILGLPF